MNRAERTNSRSVRIAALLLAGTLFAAACSGSDAASSDTDAEALDSTTTDSTTTDSTTTDSTTTDSTTTDSTTTDSTTTDSTALVSTELVSTALAALPQVSGDGTVQITVGDFAAGAELLGVEAETPDERVRWVGIPRPTTEGGLGFRIATPQFIINASRAPERIEDELGFSLLDVDIITEVAVEPERVTVFTGPEGWGGQAEPLDDGLLTIGQGDDFEIDPSAVTVLDQLGRPLRLAEVDDRLFASTSTPVLRSWIDGSGSSYADDSRLAAIGAALDEHDVVSAFLFTGEFFAIPEILSEEAAAGFLDQPFIDQPFTAVGIGNTIRDRRAIEVIAYHFVTDESAESAMPSIENAWTNAMSVATQTPISELTEFESITRTGSVVTVVTVVPQERIGPALNMLFSRDVPLAHF